MKKILSIAVIALTITSFAQAIEVTDEPGKFGIGYQGTFRNGLDWGNGISLRYAPKTVGGALIFTHYTANGREASDNKRDAWTLDAKMYYNLIQRTNSDFFVGGSLGYSKIKSKGDEDFKDKTPTLGILLGAEWKFLDIPEIGFNFEVGYKLGWEDLNGNDTDIFGTYVTIGTHYYF